MRRWAYQRAWLHSYRCPIPVIIVGNVTVGGTGKTPLVIWLAHYLTQQGWKVGIISRGYGGQARYPVSVNISSNAAQVGDEALLLARTHCPVVIAPQRRLAVQQLLAQQPCDVILSDDGLQHYALQRDIEIAVIDGQRGLGNGYCLPAGPLRELPSRLQQVDFIVSKTVAWRNAVVMTYTFSTLHALTTTTTQSLQHLSGQIVHAVAGIGHPETFFTMLEQQGILLIRHSFPDHHPYQKHDITFPDSYPVVMTEKDAVKCIPIADQRHWYLGITAQLPENFGEQVVQRLLDKI
ncbi:MAG: tetraacyldisaccharide 4'-kinase [Thiotrichaceae bacterium]